MRIHLTLDPSHLAGPSSSSGSGPLVQIGGDLVLIELQGELSYEGDKSGGVVGVLGLDRPDKPTLHLGEHHLLHGKISTLVKPYAIIRKATIRAGAGAGADGLMHENGVVEGDPEEEEEEDDGSEEEAPLFPKTKTSTNILNTPPRRLAPEGSSPSTASVYPSSTIKDYSSELDFSSPPLSTSSDRSRHREDSDSDPDSDGQEKDTRDRNSKPQAKRTKRDTGAKTKTRTRRYEVVGVVRKKVVFALRPEPIVTATILPD